MVGPPVDPTSILKFSATIGVEALSVLNKWLDTNEVQNAWYGKDTKYFIKQRSPTEKLLRNKYGKPEIYKVFTIRKEDWQLVIKESLPVAHTWHRKRKDEKGECSWLPLFWASRKALGDNQVCTKASESFTSLGVVENLPAARLDLWGLVTMAYSNGAYGEYISASDGGYRVTMFAKNFVLDINRQNINAPTTGHLEPREHPDEDREPLGFDETRYLLDHGYSFSPTDFLIGWPLTGDKESEPPEDLVGGLWDEHLKRVVIDHFRVLELKTSLESAIVDYRRGWVGFLATAKNSFKEVALRGISSELGQIQAHILRARSLQITRDSKDVGLNTVLITSEDMEIPRDILFNTPRKMRSRKRWFPEEWSSKIGEVGDLIDKQLWRIKLLFCDDVKLVDNLSRDDVIEVFHGKRKLIENFTLHEEPYPLVEHTPPARAAEEARKKLLHQHNVVTAKARMLRSCESIHQVLSTRNTGFNVLIA